MEKIKAIWNESSKRQKIMIEMIICCLQKEVLESFFQLAK